MRDERPAYFSSPWMTDYPLLDNEFRQFSTLVAERADEPQIWFGSYLGVSPRRRPVRVILVDHPPSAAFANHEVFRQGRVQLRYAPESYHEKGILTPLFYLEEFHEPDLQRGVRPGRKNHLSRRGRSSGV